MTRRASRGPTQRVCKSSISISLSAIESRFCVTANRNSHSGLGSQSSRRKNFAFSSMIFTKRFNSGSHDRLPGASVGECNAIALSADAVRRVFQQPARNPQEPHYLTGNGGGTRFLVACSKAYAI